MEIQDFHDAGFIRIMNDPEFCFTYDLAKPEHTYDEGEGPALLFNNRRSQFCVTDGTLVFMYFNAANPKEAVDWANKITSFDNIY